MKEASYCTIWPDKSMLGQHKHVQIVYETWGSHSIECQDYDSMQCGK
jgi:hypothetical protein